MRVPAGTLSLLIRKIIYLRNYFNAALPAGMKRAKGGAS